jgi:hypothetical protein
MALSSPGICSRKMCIRQPRTGQTRRRARRWTRTRAAADRHVGHRPAAMAVHLPRRRPAHRTRHRRIPRASRDHHRATTVHHFLDDQHRQSGNHRADKGVGIPHEIMVKDGYPVSPPTGQSRTTYSPCGHGQREERTVHGFVDLPPSPRMAGTSGPSESGLASTAHTWSSVRSAGQRRSLRMMVVAALMSVGCPVRSSR